MAGLGYHRQTDNRAATFGLREISTEGTQFVSTARKIFFRGTLECCIFPLTGHPPTDVESWKRIIRIAKAHGLNLLRFHSYCPPEAAFVAADELGFYYQVETCWANQSTTIGDGKPVDQWVYDETARILKAYGNHPSFLLMPYGNEPGGKQRWRLPGEVGGPLQGAGRAPPLDQRLGLAAASGEPVPRHPRPAHPALGRRAQIAHQCQARRRRCTDYRDFIRKRTVPVDQPRDRPVVRLSELR